MDELDQCKISVFGEEAYQVVASPINTDKMRVGLGEYFILPVVPVGSLVTSLPPEQLDINSKRYLQHKQKSDGITF